MTLHTDNDIGNPAVAFELDDTGGRTHRMPDYAGRSTFLALTYIIVIFSLSIQSLSIKPLCKYYAEENAD